MKLGLDVTEHRIRAVAVSDGSTDWRCERPARGDLAVDLADVVSSLPTAVREELDEVRLAIAPREADLELERVGLIRVAPGTMPALGPLASWPDELRSGLAGRVAQLSGGTNFFGTASASPRREELFAEYDRLSRCGAERTVIAAAGALAAPDIERSVERMLRDVDGETILAHTMGGIGMRERESSAVVNAGLIPWAKRTALAAAAAFPGMSVAFAHGLGGYGSPAEFCRLPLGSVEARLRAAALGAERTRGSADLLLAVLEGGSVQLFGVTDGVPDRADVGTVWGVPHNHIAIDAVTVHPEAGAASVESRYHDALAALRRRRPGHEAVMVGDVESEKIDDRFAIALGAALGRVRVEVERVVSGGATGGAAGDDEAVVALGEEGRTRAVLAGADPRMSHVVSVEARSVAYVTDPVRTVRVTVTGDPG